MFKYETRFYWHKGLKIEVERDFFLYYLWHFYRSPEGTLGFTQPMYKNHISVTLKQHHGEEAYRASKKYAGQAVTFSYSGEIRKGGSWFTNYWMPVICPRADEIKRELGIVEKNFLGYHLTLVNNKSTLNNGKANR